MTDAPAKFLLSATGQGPLTTRSLVADGYVLVPYPVLVDCSSNPMQLNVCTHCGQPGCSAGDWVALRSLGDAIVLMPRFDVEMDPDDVHRYDPPEPIQKRGAAIVRGEALDAMRRHLLTLPPPADLPSLEAREAVLCLQFEAPLGLLGRWPSSVVIDRRAVLACSEDDTSALLDQADALLQGLIGRNDPLVVQRPPGTPVALYLDGPKTPTWTPFARLASGQLAIHLSDDLDVGPASAA